MRCNNCGWDDNPAGVKKCAKCGVPLTGSMNDDVAHRQEGQKTSEEFNPNRTLPGCPNCGYALMPNVTECPNCGHSLSSREDFRIESVPETIEPPVPQKPKTPVSGTIIQGLKSFGDVEKVRKKLVGFLVTYSHSSNGEFFPLYEGKNYIGRNDTCNICIESDDEISDIHLSIRYRTVDRKFNFKDEQSTNGTFINEALTDDGELKNLDIIRIGSTKLVFIAIPEAAFEK